MNIVLVEGATNRTLETLLAYLGKKGAKAKDASEEIESASAEDLLAEAVAEVRAQNPNKPAILRYLKVGTEEELYQAVLESCPGAVDPLYNIPFTSVIKGNRAE